MKKTLLIVFALLFGLTTVEAQPKIETSTSFDEPEDGWNKLIQMKNGNTLFFHFTKKEGIEVNVYDKSRNLIATKEVTSDLWEPKKMKTSVVEGLYEINGQAVIFLQQTLDRTPTLFRLVFDANTGELVKEKRMGTLPKYGMFAGYAMVYGGVDASDFYVEKDPNSDCYAVVFFNGFAHESGERIKVVHYNGMHKKISSAYYDSPEGQFKYLRFIGMTVDGDKSIHLCTYGFNTNSDENGADSRVIISKLDAGDSTFTNKLLDFTDDFRDTKAVMKYNKGTGMIELMTLTFVKSKRRTAYYLPLISYIDPATLFVTNSQVLTTNKASEYMQAHLDNTEGYNGLPQDMIINNDNTTTVLYESEEQMERRDQRTGRVMSRSTILGNIGIAEIDNKGKEKEGYAILKKQHATGFFDPLYLSHKGKGMWSYRGGSANFMHLNNNAFLSFDYVNTDKNRYIIFNDYPVNFDRGDDVKKRKDVTTISGANTIYYRLHNGQFDKDYLFGTPSSDDQSNFCYVESSDFNKETNTYATLLMSRDGRKKEAKIAWVTFN